MEKNKVTDKNKITDKNKMTDKDKIARGITGAVNNAVSAELLEKYFRITGEALAKVKANARDEKRKAEAADFLDMAERYYSDAGHFRKQGNFVLAFAALNYAHGWLDAGARIGLFKVKDSRLFTVDD